MAERATLARPYARAIFELARADRRLDEWSRMLLVASSAAEVPKVAALLTSPDVDDRQKAFRLGEICGDDIDDRFRKFLIVLAENKRIGLIDEIDAQFEVLKAQEEQSLEVRVVSAYPLDEAQIEKIKSSLASRYGKEISLTADTDRSLIGGAVIRAGDTVIDGSVRGRLSKLSESVSRL